MNLPSSNRRQELKRALERDLARNARREKGHRTFWRSLALVGTVGWPIALAAVGGAWLGRWLDATYGTGSRLTLTLLFVGVGLGSWVAWRQVSGDRR